MKCKKRYSIFRKPSKIKVFKEKHSINAQDFKSLASAYSAIPAFFCAVIRSTEWVEVDSNHRSNLQQIYSLSPLATRESTHAGAMP